MGLQAAMDLVQEIQDSYFTRREPPLPPGYEGIWDGYFESLQQLRDALAEPVLLDEIPEVADALGDLKNGIREVGGLVNVRLHARDPEVVAAAQTLKDEFFPKGLDLITDKQHDVVGWTIQTLDRFGGEFSNEIAKIRGSWEVGSLVDRLVTYQKLAGEFYVDPDPAAALPSKADLLNACRDKLKIVMIELTHVTVRHPDYVPNVKAMLRPLVELSEKIRAENLEKTKAKKAAEAAEETEGEETEETEAEEIEDEELTEETEDEDVEDEDEDVEDDDETAEDEDEAEDDDDVAQGPPEDDEDDPSDDDACASDSDEETTA